MKLGDERLSLASRRATAPTAPVISLLTALVVLVCVLLALGLLAPPRVVPASAPPSVFSAERALAHVQVVAQQPHPLGSARQAEVRSYLVEQLTALGLRPEIQQATSVRQRGGSPLRAAGTVQNIVARIAGTDSTRAVLLMCHYDSVTQGPGANDDGAAVAALLETLRALREAPPLRNDLIVLFTDGEEPGQLGALAFVEQHPLADTVGLVLNFEARGGGGPTLMFETSPQNGWLIGEFAQAAPEPYASSLFYEVYRALPNDTDFSIFKEHGISGLNFAYLDDITYYHSARDTIANVSAPSLQHHGNYALALARHYGGLDLRRSETGDAIYFNLIGALLLHYPAGWALSLAGLLVLAWLAVIGLGLRRGRLGLWRLLAGALVLLLSMLVAAAVVALLAPLLGSRHREFFYYGETYHSRLYLLSFVALTLALTSGIHLWFRQRLGLYNLAAGATVWWLVLALLSSLLAPGASYLFVWPLLLGLAGLAALFAAGEAEQALRQRFWLLLLCAIPVLLLFAPLIYLLWVALTMRLAAVVALVLVLLLGLLLPQLSLLLLASRRLLPIGAALVGVVGLLAAALLTGPSPQHPQPNSLFYGLNADSGQAVWASTDPGVDAWTAQWLTDGTTQADLEDYFPRLPGSFPQHSAPVLPLAAPSVTLLDDRTDGALRTMRLRVSSGRAAPFVAIYVTGSGVRGVSMNGQSFEDAPQPAPPAGRSQLWGLLYWAAPAEGIELMLEAQAAAPLEIRVVDRTDGLPEIPGSAMTPRPVTMIPAPSAGIAEFSNSTMVSRSFSFPGRP